MGQKLQRKIQKGEAARTAILEAIESAGEGGMLSIALGPLLPSMTYDQITYHLRQLHGKGEIARSEERHRGVIHYRWRRGVQATAADARGLKSWGFASGGMS